MAFIKPYQLPVIAIITMQLAFFGSYIAAVLQEHIVPIVSYISDGGARIPESSVFGLMLNIGSVLTMAVMYIRYLQVAELYKSHVDKLDKNLNTYNKLSFPLVIIMPLGGTVVANFQICNVRSVHLIGAFAAFGLGTVYLWLQVCVSYKLVPFAGTRRKAHIRLVLVIACTLLYFLQLVTGIKSHMVFEGKDTLLWYPSDGGWLLHIVSSVSEWILAILFSVFFLSFTDEFRDVEIEHPQVNIAAYRITL